MSKQASLHALYSDAVLVMESRWQTRACESYKRGMTVFASETSSNTSTSQHLLLPTPTLLPRTLPHARRILPHPPRDLIRVLPCFLTYVFRPEISTVWPVAPPAISVVSVATTVESGILYAAGVMAASGAVMPVSTKPGRIALMVV